MQPNVTSLCMETLLPTYIYCCQQYETYLCLRVKFPIFLSDFKQASIPSADFIKPLRYEMSLISVHSIDAVSRMDTYINLMYLIHFMYFNK